MHIFHHLLPEQDSMIQHTKLETDLIIQSSARRQNFQGTALIIAARCIKPIALDTVRLAHSLTIFMICLDRGELTREPTHRSLKSQGAALSYCSALH